MSYGQSLVMRVLRRLLYCLQLRLHVHTDKHSPLSETIEPKPGVWVFLSGLSRDSVASAVLLALEIAVSLSL